MNIGVIGFGHLGKCLVTGMLLKSLVTSNNICITAKSATTKEIAREQYRVNVCKNNDELINLSDIIFLALKGSVFQNECNATQGHLLTGKHIVSLMAGISINEIHDKLKTPNITRAMPTVSIAQANGIIAHTHTDNIIQHLFSELGFAFEINETNIDQATAFSACGIGFAAYILQAFTESGVQMGFSPDISNKIVSTIFNNAINTPNYKETIDSVATKGGSTEQGILYFNEMGIKDIISGAINKAYVKCRHKSLHESL